MSRIPFVDSRYYSVEEYFAMDEASDTRLEYIDGQIFEMAGGSDTHSKIIHNLHGVLWYRLRGMPCQARDGNLRVQYGRKVRYGYPDALIVCGDAQFDSKSGRNMTILNPRVLFEVLSESTEAHDRGRKFQLYREIESFEEYVLVSQARPVVEVYRRQEPGTWLIQPPFEGLESVARLHSVDIDIPLSELYDGVKFSARTSTNSDVAQ